ncbi:hypothetical protein MMC21_006320 [Puttea exsequens]|nr:hypothetical protein [Puttea exsequens]
MPTLLYKKSEGRFNDKISRLLDAQFVLQDTQQQRQLCAATDALLTLHPRPIVPTGSSHRYYGLRIPELCDNFHFIYDGTCSDEMLDALVATQPPHHSSPAALYDLSLYKGFRVTELFINVPATLNALENLARGLRSGNFNFENRFVPLEIDGVHFTLPFPSLSTDEDSINDKSTVSFLEILQTAASESLNEFQNERCGDISYVGQGPSQALQQTCEGLSSYHSLAPAPLEHYMYPLPTNGFDTSVVSLQDDIDATFNPNWTMDSDGNGNLSRTFAGSDQDSLRANTSMATAVNSNWYLDSLPSDFESIDTSIARMGRTKTTFSPPSTRVVTGILNKNCQPSSVFSHTLPRTADVTEQHFKLNDQELLHSAANETQNARLYDVSHRTPRHTNLNTSAQIRRNLTSFLESPY